MKTLSTKKKYLVALYYFFKNIAPKDIPTMDDMRLIYDNILPILKDVVKEFVEIQDKVEELQKSFQRLSKDEQKSKQEDSNKKLLEFTSQSLELNDKDEDGKIELENKDFGTMFDILKKNIKTMFRTCEDTILFDRDLDVANSAPKEIPKKEIKK